MARTGVRSLYKVLIREDLDRGTGTIGLTVGRALPNSDDRNLTVKQGYSTDVFDFLLSP